MSGKPPLTDRQIEVVIGNLLRAGVLAAAVIVLAGGVFYLAHYGAQRPNYKVFSGEPADLRDISGIARDALAMHSKGVIQLGLILLIATPVSRVAFSIAAFAAQRDRLYVALTIIVLSILVFSLAGGHF
ncbi:MAG: DUF1634 domain-containing protein [Actinomycetota bacterium]|nr:DUF1634 domain-containing protein [Actinomycetota bacterium]